MGYSLAKPRGTFSMRADFTPFEQSIEFFLLRYCSSVKPRLCLAGLPHNSDVQKRQTSVITFPKLWISQSEALFTVMIFYDIKSLTWYRTISSTVSKTRTFLQTFEMKITTEIQRNVKLLHLLNDKVICLTLTEKKKNNFAPKLDETTLAGARVYVYGQCWNFFVWKWSRIFQISLLIWTSKIPKMKRQTKEL